MLKIIMGNDPFLEKQSLENMLSKLKFSEETVDLRRFSSHDQHFSFTFIEEALYTPSLFQEAVVVVFEAYDLNKEQEQTLLRLLERDFTHEHLLLILKNKPKGNTKLGRLCKKLKAIDLSKESQTGFQAYLDKALKKQGIQIENQAKHLLAERVDHNYQRLAIELEKLAVLDREIKLADIKSLVVKNLEDDVFALSDAVLQRQQKQAFAIYYDLQEQGIDPLQLIGLLGSSIRRIFQVSVLAQKGYQATSIAQYLAMSDRQVYFLMNHRQQDPQALLILMRDLAQIDYQVKTGYLNKDLGFEIWLLKASH